MRTTRALLVVVSLLAAGQVRAEDPVPPALWEGRPSWYGWQSLILWVTENAAVAPTVSTDVRGEMVWGFALVVR